MVFYPYTATMPHASRFLFAFVLVIATATLFDTSSRATVEAKTVEEIVKSSPLSTDKDKATLYGGCEGDPYQALKPYISGGIVIPTQSGGSLKNGIDPALACRLSKLLAFAHKNSCPARIISGFRSASHQASICGAGRPGCAAPGRSCHQPGRAVDVSTDCGGRLRGMAKQFQLHFPYSGNHIQCLEHRCAGVSCCSQPCNGGVAIDGDGGNYSAAPMGLGNQFREAMTGQPTGGTGQGGGQQQPLPPQPQQPQIPSQPSPLQPTDYFPKTPTPTQPRGTTSSSTLDTRFDTYEEPPPSVGQKLIDLAYGTEEIATTSHATSVPIYIDGSDVAQLDDENGKDTVGGQAPKRFVQIQPPTTFTSDDLGSGSYSSTESGSMLAQALFNIREALLRLLEILRPFGLRNALEGVAEDEYYELHE